MNLAHGMNHLAIAGYILSFIFLNLVAYLISSFYRKKFGQASPRIGFLAAVACLSLYAAGFVFSPPGHPAWTAGCIMLLFAGATASSWNAIALYYTMKKVRK